MPKLAVAWTRPETVRDDVARVLAISGFSPEPGEDTAVLQVGDAGHKGLGPSTMPWQSAGAIVAVEALGVGTPTHRLTAHTRVVLHLPVAAGHSELGVDGCLGALAASRSSLRGVGRKDPVETVLVAAQDAWSSDVRHWFLLDATTVPGGENPTSDRQACNLLLAGPDPVALDAMAARLLGLDPATVPLLARAAAAGLGDADPDITGMVGDLDTLVARPIRMWRPSRLSRSSRYIAAALLRRRPRRAGRDITPWHALWRECRGDITATTGETRHV